jgi:hypothetical protein
MNYYIIGIVSFFIILVSIQYTLNKILVILKDIDLTLKKINFKS